MNSSNMESNNSVWIIKASYPSGGHTVQWNDAPLRFRDKQAAAVRAEALNAAIRKSGDTSTHYLVVEEGV